MKRFSPCMFILTVVLPMLAAPSYAQDTEPEHTLLAECGGLRSMFGQPLRMGEVLDYFHQDAGALNLDRRAPVQVTVLRSSDLPPEAVVMQYTDRAGGNVFTTSGGVMRQGRDDYVMSVPRINLRNGAADTTLLFQVPLGLVAERELPADAADNYYVNGEEPVYDRAFARQRYNFTGRCEVVGE